MHALAFADERPFELGKGAHDRQQQVGHRRVLAGKGELFFDELDPYAAGGEGPDDGAQVVEVSGEPVHRVHDEGVAVADEPE